MFRCSGFIYIRVTEEGSYSVTRRTGYHWILSAGSKCGAEQAANSCSVWGAPTIIAVGPSAPPMIAMAAASQLLNSAGSFYFSPGWSHTERS